MPCLSLQPGLMDVFGKSLAMLFQIFLLAGPDPAHIRAFCSRVRSFTTDMGVERGIVEQPEFLFDLLELIDPKFHVGILADQGDHQFPSAIAVPGWKHAWDLLLEKRPL